MTNLKGIDLAVDVNLLSNFINKSNLNYLEIGCFDGVTLTRVALNYTNKKIYGIDPFISDGYTGTPISTRLKKQKENLYHNITNVDNILFFELTTDQFVQVEPNYKKLNIDCIFIDGSHHYDDIMIDIDAALICINNNDHKKGIIIFHDLHIQDVVDAISQFKINCDNKNISCKDISECQNQFKVFEVDFNR